MNSGQSSHSRSQPTQSVSTYIFGHEVGSDQVDRKPLITDQMGFSKTESVHLPWWVQHQDPSSNQNYIKYLAESSAFAQTVLPSEPDMAFESLPLPATGVSCHVSGLSNFSTDQSYNVYLGQAGNSTSNELDSWKFSEDLGNQFSTRQHQARNQSSWMLNSSGDGNVSRVAAPVGSPTQPQPKASSAKSRANDRRRRIQINEKLTALQELLPHSGVGRQASIMDDIIDYAKNLQLQIKDACKRKTRLECESTTEPIFFREGFGHYFCNEPVLNEPLEEMVGKLLELNPTEALQLLETKGLLLMPIEFAEALC